MLAFTVGLLAVISLGLSAGALLAEACILVPFWRAERPDSFLDWYERHAEALVRFFGPLEVASGLFVLAAAALGWTGHLAGTGLFTAAAALTVAVLASFPVYFREANASFATRVIHPEDVPAELRRWSAWHWGRTGAAVAAFGLAAAALARTAG